MSNFMLRFFGPLSKDYCNYFLFLAMFFFFFLVLFVIFNIYYLIKNFKSIKSADLMSSFLMILNLLIAYFVNRLLYTMCIK